MQEKFKQGWIPPVNITVDESFWAFKGMKFLKRYMSDKPQEFGFLEYALCTMNGYFLCVVVHHVPGEQKRKQRGFDETNLDMELLLQLKLQEQIFYIPKCNYTGTQKIQLNKKEGARPLSFLEYRNLPHKWEKN